MIAFRTVTCPACGAKAINGSRCAGCGLWPRSARIIAAIRDKAEIVFTAVKEEKK
jgi:ribosomal protein L37E